MYFKMFHVQEDLSVVGIQRQKDAPAPLSPAEEEAKMSQLSDTMKLVGVEAKGTVKWAYFGH